MDSSTVFLKLHAAVPPPPSLPSPACLRAESWESIVGVWALAQGVHVVLRYRALSTLCFDTLSRKRALLLASDHVQGLPLRGVAALNADEPLATPAWMMRPGVTVGCSVREAFGGQLPSGVVLEQYLQMYRGERYVLVWRDGAAWVILKQGPVGPLDLLRAHWQAAWLHQHMHPDVDLQGRGGGGNGTAVSSAAHAARAGTTSDGAEGHFGAAPEALAASVGALHERFDAFLSEGASRGWRMDTLQLRLGPLRLSVPDA